MMDLDEFSVATFNLYNMQEAGKKLYTEPGWTPTQFNLKVNWTIFQLTMLEYPHIVGMQELWSKDALNKILTTGDVEEHRLDKKYDMLADPATGGHIVCAALVRKGLLTGDPEWIEDFPDEVKLDSKDDPQDPQAPAIKITLDKFSRPVLHFQVKLRENLPPTEVFVAHLKSKLPTQLDKEKWFKADPDAYKPHRVALGGAISKESDTPVIVLGDSCAGERAVLRQQPQAPVDVRRSGDQQRPPQLREPQRHRHR
jgi:hypothetical protein